MSVVNDVNVHNVIRHNIVIMQICMQFANIVIKVWIDEHPLISIMWNILNWKVSIYFPVQNIPYNNYRNQWFFYELYVIEITYNGKVCLGAIACLTRIEFSFYHYPPQLLSFFFWNGHHHAPFVSSLCFFIFFQWYLDN